MFDLFGIRRRREEKRQKEEAERQAALAEAKKKYQERKRLITDWLSVYRKEQESKNSKDYSERKDAALKANSKCPKCGSKNVVNHIKRTKGEIHGSGSVSGSSSHYGGLFTFSSHSYISGKSKIDGELDTLPVNKCKDCGHEWKIEEAKYKSAYDIFSTYSSHYPDMLFHRLDDYFELTFDPNDIKEECNSLEEKKEKFIDNIAKNKYTFTPLRKLPRYMLDYMLYQGITHWHFREENVEPSWGFKRDDDEFTYQMTDELWNIVKKMINWEGTKE